MCVGGVWEIWSLLESFASLPGCHSLISLATTDALQGLRSPEVSRSSTNHFLTLFCMCCLLRALIQFHIAEKVVFTHGEQEEM